MTEMNSWNKTARKVPQWISGKISSNLLTVLWPKWFWKPTIGSEDVYDGFKKVKSNEKNDKSPPKSGHSVLLFSDDV